MNSHIKNEFRNNIIFVFKRNTAISKDTLVFHAQNILYSSKLKQELIGKEQKPHKNMFNLLPAKIFFSNIIYEFVFSNLIYEFVFSNLISEFFFFLTSYMNFFFSNLISEIFFAAAVEGKR